MNINFRAFPKEVKSAILNLISNSEFPMTGYPVKHAKYKNKWNDFLYDLKCELTKKKK